jgi:2-dehydro-3-deoxyphosphogluconate aldolase / (4S)-4-hydroxy-2-oxoglutarate aldolase
MARFSRLQVLETMERFGLVPLFYHENIEVAKKIAEALADGGSRVIEFANRGDRAFEVYREVAVHMEALVPDLIMGIGSVIDAPTAGLYINLGANFVVSPTMHQDVAKLCNLRKIAFVPGCGTATEISEAEELGIEICKIFPGSQLGGPGFVRAVKGPCPWVKLMPTGGVEVTYENLRGWFESGVACVGIGSSLVRKDLVAAENWGEISVVTRQSIKWIADIRSELRLSE